jgi:hypothetical protein
VTWLSDRPRLFSPRECARLQGFPETFDMEDVRCTRILNSPCVANGCHLRLQIPMPASYRLLGNAVSPPVVAIMAGSLLCALFHRGACRHCGAGLRLRRRAGGASVLITIVRLCAFSLRCFRSAVADGEGGAAQAAAGAFASLRSRGRRGAARG